MQSLPADERNQRQHLEASGLEVSQRNRGKTGKWNGSLSSLEQMASGSEEGWVQDFLEDFLVRSL